MNFHSRPWLFVFAALAVLPARAVEPLPVVDLSQDTARHVMIAQGRTGIFQGHPTTLLLPVAENWKTTRDCPEQNSVVSTRFTLATTDKAEKTRAAAEPRVFRTFMPEAGPSAFGVVLRADLALCYDPQRGGVSQVWRGSLDLAPTMRAKINAPAVIQGTIYYRETMRQPLRVGAVEQEPARRSKGYRYDGDAVVFEFTLDGTFIRETLRATRDGRGLERVWSAPEGAVLYFRAEPQPDARVTFSGAEEVAPGVWRHEGGAGKVFVMQIQSGPGA